MTTRDRIVALSKHEAASVARFAPEAYGGLQTPLQRVQAAKMLLCIEENGSMLPVQEWGIQVPDLPILWQLTVQPSLIVDVWPMSEAQFVSRYGVNPYQFAELARCGFVIPNLYHYDSDSQAGFAKHEAKSDVLMPILAFEQTHCRINSIRRAPFLRAVAGSRFEEVVNQGKRLFHPLLSTLQPDLLERLTRNETLSGALHKVATNWAYILAFRGEDAWTQRMVEGGAGDAQRELRRLIARYTAAAAPYTAAFGGTHLVSPRQIDAVREEAGDVQFITLENRSILEKERWPGLQALTEAGLIRYTLDSPLPEQALDAPAVPEQRHFDNFLAFLRGTIDRRIRMQSFLAEAQSVSKDLNLALKHWTDYFKLYQALKGEEEAARRKGLWVGVASWAGPTAIGTMLGAVAGPLLFGEDPGVISRRMFLGATLGGLITGTASGVSSLVSDVLRPQPPEPHRKLLGRYEDFHRWQIEAGGARPA